MAKAAKQGAAETRGTKSKDAPKREKKTDVKKAPAKKAAARKPVAAQLDARSVSALQAVGASRPADIGPDVLGRLFDVVTSRRGADPTLSHSARLLARGRRKIAQKFGEEAVECLIEAVAGNPRELIGESADVLYHLVVMWVDVGVRPEDVWAELARREGTSGIAEKAGRAPDPLDDPADDPADHLAD